MMIDAALQEAMIGVPLVQAPQNRDDFLVALTAEQIRTGLFELWLRGGFERVHVLSIRRWVIAKLTGVTRDSGEEVAQDFRDILADGFGSLELTGDVVPLRGGYYLPTPPAIIRRSDDASIVISGFPLHRLRLPLDRFQLSRTGRVVRNLTPEQAMAAGFTIVGPDEYTGMVGSPASPSDFMRQLLGDSPEEPWDGRQEWQPYSGTSDGTWGYGFGRSTRRVPIDASKVELWRSPIGADCYEHFLRKDSHNTSTRVSIPREAWRQVALALDLMHGSQREVLFSRVDNNIVIASAFPYPIQLHRLIYAGGATWRGSRGGRVRYEMPAASFAIFRSAAERVWIKLREAKPNDITG